MDLYMSGERLEVIAEEETDTEQEQGSADEASREVHGEDIHNVDKRERVDRYGMWDKGDVGLELPTKEPYVLVTEKMGGPPAPPASTFQRFSVETNESLHFEPYIPLDEDEPGPVRRFGGKAVDDNEVFEEEVGREGPGESPGDSMVGRVINEQKAMEGCEGSESEPLDMYCTDCKIPIRAFQRLFDPHKNHQVILITKAAEEIKDDVHTTMRKLEEQITQMENFAGHLEEIFITVEENFGRQEQNLEQHYNDVIQTLTQRYDERASRLEDEKKLKLESLYSQLLDCGRTLDLSKDLIETAQEMHRNEDKLAFLQNKGLHQGGAGSQAGRFPQIQELHSGFVRCQTNDGVSQHCTSPSAPVINPQVPNSASRTSVRVCWSLFSDDTVEYYKLHYRPVLEDSTAEDSQTPEASMIKVKETYRTVTDLLPNAQYEFWVTATNTTGISPASEKAVYMTVPSPPVVKPRECASCPSGALIRWDSGNTNPVDSYTVELREISEEWSDTAITESIVAIPTCECLIQLQPGKLYSIAVRAVNIGGPSDRSNTITVRTIGTFFHLLEDTAHPCLSISEEGFTIFYGDKDLSMSDMIFSDNTFARCVAVLGELIPVRGTHYWEVEVEDSTEFRIGVAYQDTQRNGYLGGNNTSWCMRHVVTPSRHKYEFLHNGWTPDIRITIHPHRIGVALDYDTGKLSFFNAGLWQHLHTFDCHFLHYVHPCFALDNPGVLTVHNGIETPNYVRFV